MGTDLHDRLDLVESFPLFPAQEFDYCPGDFPWKVGLQSTAPPELKKRVIAAVASTFLRLKSIDGTLKRYFASVEVPKGNDQRLDLQVICRTRVAMESFSEAIKYISSLPDKSTGQAIGEWALLRTPFSMEMLQSCANRGALFEPLTIARMMLEQLAWVIAAAEESDPIKVSNINAQSSIGVLKSVVPEAGRFYGWLSSHAHWKYDAHIKSMVHEEDGSVGHVYASTYFKALSLSVSLVLAVVFVKYSKVMLRRESEKDILKALEAAEREIISLFREIQTLFETDEEFSSLALIMA